MAKKVIEQITYTCDICGCIRNHGGIEECTITLYRSDQLAGYETKYDDVCDTCRNKVIKCIDGLKEIELLGDDE